MKTLLFGNGINIEFGGADNLNKSIILRAIKSTKEDDFPTHIIVDDPSLIVSLLGHLFLQVREILNGGYDSYAYTTDLKGCLDDFKRLTIKSQVPKRKIFMNCSNAFQA